MRPERETSKSLPVVASVSATLEANGLAKVASDACVGDAGADIGDNEDVVQAHSLHAATVQYSKIVVLLHLQRPP